MRRHIEERMRLRQMIGDTIIRIQHNCLPKCRKETSRQYWNGYINAMNRALALIDLVAEEESNSV